MFVHHLTVDVLGPSLCLQTAEVLAEDRKAHGLPAVNEGTEADGAAEKPFDPETSLWKPKA